jgi:hypothetical protein
MAMDGSALGMTKDATNCIKHDEKYFCESVISECISASGFGFRGMFGSEPLTTYWLLRPK